MTAAVALAIAATPLVLGPGEQACSRDPSQKATHSFFWDWGESGVVCAKEAAVLQQLAPQLNRTVIIQPLASALVAVEPTRNERIAWYSKEKTLELELEDAKAKGLELYRNNEALRRENRLHEVRKGQLELELEGVQDQVATLEATLSEATRENANLLHKLERAETLAAFAPRGAEHGIVGPDVNVVDGDR